MLVIYCFCPDIQVTVDGVREILLMRDPTYTLLNLNISDALNGRRILISRGSKVTSNSCRPFKVSAGIITFKLRTIQMRLLAQWLQVLTPYDQHKYHLTTIASRLHTKCHPNPGPHHSSSFCFHIAVDLTNWGLVSFLWSQRMGCKMSRPNHRHKQIRSAS